MRKLPEPLVPSGGAPSTADNQQLMAALTAFEARQKADNFSALELFLSANPQSPWRLAVQANLGLLYYRAGYFSKCIPAYLEAWKAGMGSTDSKVKALADLAAGEYAAMLARLGRYTELKSFLDSVEGREFIGKGREMINASREGAATMEKRPEIAFRCGPMALSRILASQGSPLWSSRVLGDSKSTMKGMSLNEVAELSAELGMNYQAARRPPGAELIMPSVIHWKAGHYAALIKKVGDRYLSQDPTFGSETWHTLEALEAEASGYFVVPPGSFPAGWVSVTDEEAAQVFGKGQLSSKNTGATSQGDKQSGGCPPGKGMAGYSFHSMLASLSITDTPVGYSPPYGDAVEFTAAYAQREATQPGNFNYSNLGPKWNFNWQSYITDDPANPATAIQVPAGGGLITYSYSGIVSGQHTFAPQFDTSKRLSRPTSGLPYTIVNADGSQEIYGQSDGSTVAPRKVFLTQLIDPHGNTTTLSYDANLRITALTDAIGQQTAFSYDLPGDIYKITKVTDPFGRFAQFFYDGSGRLMKIRDVIGIESAFTYEGAGDFIKSLTTPYGTTKFTQTSSGSTQRVTATDPAGDTEVMESYPDQNAALAFSESPAPQGLTAAVEFNQNLYFRNSFHWDKKQWKEGANDYTKAHIYHWLHDQNFNVMSRHLESEKEPLKARVWYAYPGQTTNIAVGTGTTPIAIGRAIEGGSQIGFQSFNAIGRLTASIDPLGRKTTYAYGANNIDLLTIKREPGGARYTAINAGGSGVASYETDRLVEKNGNGGVFSVTDTINLAGVTDPAPASVYQSERWGACTYRFPNLASGASYKVRFHFAEIFYGSAGARRFNVAINGSQVLTDFDVFAEAGNLKFKAIVREFTVSPDVNNQIAIQLTQGAVDYPKVSGIELINLSAPAATFPVTLASFTYNAQHLPLTHTDAAGQTTTYTYNANGQITSVTNAKSETTAYTYYTADAAGRQRKGRLQQIDGALAGSADVTTFDYDAVGRFEKITGPDGYYLGFTYDALDRPVRTIFPDGTYTETTYQALDPATSRDRLGRITSYAHNSLRQLASVTDPANRTTQFTWCKCGDMRQLIDPLGRVTTWKHDVAGRVTQKIYTDGSAINFAYEPLSGRLLSVTDEKGQVKTLGYKLDDSPAGISYSNTPVATPAVSFSYDMDFPRRISMTDGTGTTTYAYHAIAPGTPGAGSLASVDGPLPNDTATYSYDELGRVTTRAINAVGETRSFDALGRLTSSVNPLGTFGYTYAGATGRVSTVNYPNGMTGTYGYHPLSGDFRLQSITHTLPGSVPVGQHIYGYDAHGRITNWTIQDGGLPPLAWTAGYDNADRLTSFTSTGNSYAYTYDAADNRLTETVNGNTTAAVHNSLNEVVSVSGAAPPSTRAYTWDAQNRMVAIDYTGTTFRTEFTYDGLDRCVRTVEKDGASVTADRWHVWCGYGRCEERDAAGATVLRRFFAEGEQAGGLPFYYSRDHLGSVRQVADASTVRTRYEYDAWGRRIKVSGDVDAAFGFTGHLVHASSGLLQAPFRAYDPQFGRWLNRDPIGEHGGTNLFAYVSNHPTGLVDVLGLDKAACDKAAWLQQQIDVRERGMDALGRSLFRESTSYPVTYPASQIQLANGGVISLPAHTEDLPRERFDWDSPSEDYEDAVFSFQAMQAVERATGGGFIIIHSVMDGFKMTRAAEWYKGRTRYLDIKSEKEQLQKEYNAAQCECRK